ncbi:unnamed protein product [Schistosoma turkestanicum]|nr:unnamed protein product [Schistosoma turkestanicum]
MNHILRSESHGFIRLFLFIDLASWIPIASRKRSSVSSVQKPIAHEMNHDSSDHQTLNNTDPSKYTILRYSTHLQILHQPNNYDSSKLYFHDAQNVSDYTSVNPEWTNQSI